MRAVTLRRALMIVIVLAVFAIGVRFSFADEWPSRPIQIIVGFSAGGTSDLITRALAESLKKTLATPVVVENKPGAASLLALGQVAKAKPDGYTLGQISCNSITERPFFMQIPFDPVKAFSYICQVFDYGYGFAVRSDAPWKTFSEFVETAKKQPGKLSVSMSGPGSSFHVALAKLEQKIPGLKFKIVPYKGGIDAVTALLGGHVDACFQSQEWKPYVDSGKLRLLAVPAKERLKDYPNIPTWIELGYNVYAQAPGAYVGPAGLSEKIRGRLEQGFRAAMDDGSFKSVVKHFSLIEAYRPGKELHEDLMKMYEENKTILPKLGIQEN